MASQSHTNYAYEAKDWNFHKKSFSFQPLAHLLGDILFALSADQCFAADTLKRICQKEGLPSNVPTDYHSIGGENRVVCCRRMQRATTCRRWKTEYGELHCLIVEMCGDGVLVRSVCCIEYVYLNYKLYYLLHIEFELWLHTVQPPLDWPGPGVNTLVGVNNRLIESDSIWWQLKSTC